MANGYDMIYDRSGRTLGVSELPQTVKSTMFGNVISSGNVYRGTGQTTTAKASTPTTGIVNSVSFGGGTGQAAFGNAKLNARDAYQSAIGTLMGGVDSARAAASASQEHIGHAQSDLNMARGLTDRLGAYAGSVSGEGDALSAFARSLMGGDASVGGLAGSYLGTLDKLGSVVDSITPDRYVAQAASDTQSAYDNALGQQQRALSRQGVDAGSGAAAALRQQYSRQLATALAAAKTKARGMGLEDQLKGLATLAGAQQEVANTAMSASGQATQSYAQAAGIVKDQGQAYANIGGVEVNLGELELSNDKAVQDALESAAAAQQAMAKFYQDTMPQKKTQTQYNADGTATRTTSKSYFA